MIYLDNAATTFPKPERVYREVDKFTRNLCGNPGRSSHRLSLESSKRIYICREKIAEMFGGSPENIVFTLNATYALNMAINALYRRGSRVLISSVDHNAVYRPVSALTGGSFSVFSALGDEDAVLSDFEAKLTPDTTLVVVNHVSNLCGITLPVEKIGQICHNRGISFVIDASQSAGTKKIDIGKCFADAVCAPGHKGLYGMQGSGFAVFSRRCAERAGTLPLFVSGGNGVDSLDSRMPDFLPERYEAGTPSTPSIIALSAGIDEVNKLGTEYIDGYEVCLAERLKDNLLNISGVRLYAPNERGGSVLFNLDGVPSERVGAMLDTEGICVRSGFHCCPLGHRLLGTGENGAVRASFSVFNSKRDADALAKAVLSLSHRK